jgi:hypothetical protein
VGSWGWEKYLNQLPCDDKIQPCRLDRAGALWLPPALLPGGPDAEERQSTVMALDPSLGPVVLAIEQRGDAMDPARLGALWVCPAPRHLGASVSAGARHRSPSYEATRLVPFQLAAAIARFALANGRGEWEEDPDRMALLRTKLAIATCRGTALRVVV